ncbi:hypothetical protein L6654_36175, partial [Bradyrhizobium sp. WYCCWR 13023]|nr:hypothetical protein [Bradyrhizobium zhengyangense]
MPGRREHLTALAVLAAAVLATTPASAQKQYDPGASDTEIKIGNIMPYSVRLRGRPPCLTEANAAGPRGNPRRSA